MPRAKKQLGQHFLTSERVARSIAEAADIRHGDVVLEVGPGKGMLTRELLQLGAQVVAIEKDADMVPLLHDTFAVEIAAGQLTVVHADILHVDPLAQGLHELAYKVVANIPYYITGQILRHFLSSLAQPSLMVLLIQKEVADRIVARDNKESILSLSVKVFGAARKIANVSARYFSPKPTVDSAIICIDTISRKFFDNPEQEERFFALIKHAFGTKRKQLGGTLRTHYKDTAEALAACHIDAKARPEDVPLEGWKCLVSTLD